nr:MAG TPA: hypothetical protein [Caudoviricetes sp.]
MSFHSLNTFVVIYMIHDYYICVKNKFWRFLNE